MSNRDRTVNPDKQLRRLLRKERQREQQERERYAAERARLGRRAQR